MIPNNAQLNPEPKGEPHLTDVEYRNLMGNAPESGTWTPESMEHHYHDHLKAERHKEVKNEWPGEQPKPF